MKKTVILTTLILACWCTAAFAAPKIFFTDLTDGPTSGWEDGSTKGAAVTIWGIGLGSSRGSSYVKVGGVNLTQDADYAEWGATSNPTTARGLRRITFWLKSSMPQGGTTISVTTSAGTSNSLPFYCRSLGGNSIYFISRSGSDSNNGLYASQGSGSNGPWRSANKVRTLQAGDVCYFRSGTWSEQDAWSAVIDFWSNNHGNGTANKSISVASYPTEVAQWGGSSISYTIRHHGSSPDLLSYWTFSKLKLRANNQVTYWSGTGSDDHIRFIGNDISTTYGGKSAACFDGCGGGETYLYFYGNYVCDAGVDSRGQTAPTQAYPLYFKGYGTHNYIYVGWNEFAYNEYGRGIQVYGHESGDWIDNVYIHDNYIHDNGMTGAILGGSDGGGGSFVRTQYFYNNIIAENGDRNYPGIFLGGSGGDYLIYNNTFYHNDNGELELWSASHDSLTIRNNIICPLSGESYYVNDNGGATGSNNLYYGAGSGPGWDSNRLDNVNPQFIDSSPNTDLGFQLQESSPAKDAGTSSVSSIVTRDYSGASRPQGAGYSIGAYEYYEYTESEPEPPAPSPPSYPSIPTSTPLPESSSPSDDGSTGGADGGGGGGGGCYIVTATFGTPLAKEVAVLSEFRDSHLLTNKYGSLLVELYEKIGPQLARYIEDREWAKFLSRLALKPVIWFAKLALQK
ncbi:CFI-box-CTERM domain-containing protein [Candidatus Omnitrophota bacterium]